VVWLGGGADGGRERLAEFGAAKVYVADGEGVDDYVVAPAAEVISFAKRPPRQAGTVVKDDGDGGVKAAEFLASQKFI
jgi:hypothetical protein